MQQKQMQQNKCYKNKNYKAKLSPFIGKGNARTEGVPGTVETGEGNIGT